MYASPDGEMHVSVRTRGESVWPGIAGRVADSGYGKRRSWKSPCCQILWRLLGCVGIRAQGSGMNPGTTGIQESIFEQTFEMICSLL